MTSLIPAICNQPLFTVDTRFTDTCLLWTVPKPHTFFPELTCLIQMTLSIVSMLSIITRFDHHILDCIFSKTGPDQSVKIGDQKSNEQSISIAIDNDDNVGKNQ